MYQEAKDWHQKVFTDGVMGAFRHPPYHIFKFNNLSCVASSFHYKDGSHKVNTNTACHAGIYSGQGDQLCFIDSIQGEKFNCDLESCIVYLQYFMDHPLFKQTFLEHDARKAFEERMTVNDLSALPANVTAFRLISGRAIWESFQIHCIKWFIKLLDTGISKDMAFLLCWWINDMKLTSPINPGHSCLDVGKLSVDYAKNYLAHAPKGARKGLLSDGVNYYSDEYSVDSVFENKPSGIYTGNSSKSFKSMLDEVLGDGKLTNNQLIELERQLRDE